MTNHNSL